MPAFSSHFDSASSRIRVKLSVAALLGSALMGMSGCADWWAYNFASQPKTLTVIHEEKLTNKWQSWADGKNRKAVPVSAKLADSEWGAAFENLTRGLYGWQPDFCELYIARKNPPNYIDRDIEPHFSSSYFRNELWRSYLRNVYFDVMLRTPTVKRQPPLSETVTKILQLQNELGTGVNSREDLKTSLVAIQETAPACDGTGEVAYAPGNDSDPTPYVSQSFLKGLLESVDEDHDGLLVDSGTIDADRAKAIAKHRDEWLMLSESQGRALTVSKQRPAAISASVIRPVPSGAPEGKPLILQLSDGAQKEMFQNYLASAVGDCSKKPDDQKCKEAKTKAVMEALNGLTTIGAEKKESPSPISPFQTFELTLSSILNSPDTANRLEYVTTYLAFYDFPYPIHSTVTMEDEFWLRLRAKQKAKTDREKLLSFSIDLDAVWESLKVRIESVETTVVPSPIQEIASVSREGSQSVEIKPQPSIELKGTVKGAIETPLSLSSSTKTSVSEKLLREFDRRSVWLNRSRDVMRITQRGMDAVNIAGGLREKVTLRVPPAATGRHVLDLKDGKPEFRRVDVPLYTKVQALAISLGVVREPYQYKRSATEKFGLPDGADSYYLVVLPYPEVLTLWTLDRKVSRLTSDILDLEMRPPGLHEKQSDLMFYSPESQESFPAYVSSSAESWIKEKIQNALYSQLNPAGKKKLVDMPGDKKQQESNKEEDVLCVKEGNNSSFYLILQGKNAPHDSIWIGKEMEKGAPNTPSSIHPFNGLETGTLQELVGKGFCR